MEKEHKVSMPCANGEKGCHDGKAEAATGSDGRKGCGKEGGLSFEGVDPEPTAEAKHCDDNQDGEEAPIPLSPPRPSLLMATPLLAAAIHDKAPDSASPAPLKRLSKPLHIEINPTSSTT